MTSYVEVDEIQAWHDKAISLGDKTLVTPVPIRTGHCAWETGPDGDGIIQPKKP